MRFTTSAALQKAERFLNHRKLAGAISEQMKQVQRNPANPPALNALGDLLLRAGDRVEALRSFSRAADAYRHGGFVLKAIATYKKILKLDPGNASSLISLASLYSQQGLLTEALDRLLEAGALYLHAQDLEGALSVYREAVVLAPRDPEVNGTLAELCLSDADVDGAHDAFLEVAASLLERREVGNAVEAACKAVALKPDSIRAVCALADGYIAQGATNQAINLLNDGLKGNADDPRLLYLLARTSLDAGLLDQADQALGKITTNEFDFARLSVDLACALSDAGDLDRAATNLTRALDAMPSKDQIPMVLDALDRILGRNPLHLASMKLVARAHSASGSHDESIVALNSLVEVAIEAGEYHEAATALAQLVRLEPLDRRHLERLGRLGTEPPAPALTAPSSGPATSHLDESVTPARKWVLRLATNEGRLVDQPHSHPIGGGTEPDNGFELLAGFDFDEELASIERSERRTIERMPFRAPVVAMIDGGKWTEFTESVDISRIGIRLRLVHRVEPGTPLRIQIALPWEVRPNSSGKRLWQIRSVVRHVANADGEHLVGAEFGVMQESLVQ